uniref:Uncharacterized protein n=1 Tax=Triticum urartu TaxID=4572 RepID=A0A8R7UEW8_TRIUA
SNNADPRLTGSCTRLRNKVQEELRTTPKFHDNAPRRENGAKHRHCRVPNRHRFSPETRTRRAPRRRLQDDNNAPSIAVVGDKARSFCSATPASPDEVSRASVTSPALHIRIGATPLAETKSAPEPPAAPPTPAHTTKRECLHCRHGACQRANHADRHPGPPPRHPCPRLHKPSTSWCIHLGRSKRELLSLLAQHESRSMGRCHNRKHPRLRL